MNLAHADKLARDNNGKMFLLVRQDQFDRSVDAKRMKTKIFREPLPEFLNKTTERIEPKKTRVGKGTKFGGEFKKSLQS